MEENINEPDLYVCEASSSISDQIISTSSIGQQSSVPVVQLSSSTASSNEKYTREKIQHLLKYNKTQYVVLDNMNNKKSSICWRSFGFPAKLDSNDTPKKIEGFVSCKSCFTTYSYISNSTSYLKKHDCQSSDRKPNSTSSSSRTSSTSQSLITAYGHPKSIRLPDSHAKEMKDLLSRWICKDMRPFAIVDDAGFREIAQRCVSIGN